LEIVRPLGSHGACAWVLAVLSTITIIHRIAYTYQQTRILDAQAAEAAAQTAGNDSFKT